jgi:hypothetical protein
MERNFLFGGKLADCQGKLNPVSNRPSVAERRFWNPVVPVQIGQHKHERAALPVQCEGLVTITRLDDVVSPTLADCRIHLAGGIVVTYFKDALPDRGGFAYFPLLWRHIVANLLGIRRVREVPKSGKNCKSLLDKAFNEFGCAKLPMATVWSRKKNRRFTTNLRN